MSAIGGQPTIDGDIALPCAFARIPGLADEVLVTSLVGEHCFVSHQTISELAEGRVISDGEQYFALRAKHVLASGNSDLEERLLAAKLRTRKAFLRGGASLHIMVVTLRCDHSCQYCQVSRAPIAAPGYDMSEETARRSVELVLQFPSKYPTIEFQGGEPLLNFQRIREIVLAAKARAGEVGKEVRFTIATTLHHATDEVLDFFAEHEVHVSTSLDGPPNLHDSARRLPGGESSAKTLRALDRARRRLGDNSIAALTTLTRENLNQIETTVDYLVGQGFRSLFIRGLSPFGFARKTQSKIGYGASEFCDAYIRALRHMFVLNRKGVEVSEAYASLLLANILTPFASNYVDLRSPLGAGLGALVYNYDGCIYPSDEARMLAEQGDKVLQLGTIRDNPQTLLSSDAMQVLLAAGIAEALPGCSDCAFLPFCGADPIHTYATQGDFVGHRAFSDFCKKQTAIFNFLFQQIYSADAETSHLLRQWAYGRGGL